MFAFLVFMYLTVILASFGLMFFKQDKLLQPLWIATVTSLFSAIEN